MRICRLLVPPVPPSSRALARLNRNVEIKAVAHDPQALGERARALADRGPVQLYQEDTFFPARHGRLKLRKFSSTSGELIQYDRPSASGPSESCYRIAELSDPDAVLALLSEAIGVRGRVKKKRTLYISGATRIHLDEVEGLGHFVELEVVLSPGKDRKDGELTARRLMDELGIRDHDLLDKSYVDMLEEKAGRDEG